MNHAEWEAKVREARRKVRIFQASGQFAPHRDDSRRFLDRAAFARQAEARRKAERELVALLKQEPK